MNRQLCAVIAVALAAGCASNPDKIQAAYVSPLQYQNYDCRQITMEQSRIERKTSSLYADLKAEADADAAQMGVGLILFWPTLFFLEGGDDARFGEYVNLKGQYEALETTAV